MEPGLDDDDLDFDREALDGDPTDPARRPPSRPPRKPFRLTTRGLMIAVAVLAVEWLILIEAHKLGPGIEFTLFIGSVLGMLDLLVPGYLDAADRINSAPPERQGAEMLNLGCLLFLIAMFTVPISLVILFRNSGR